MGRTLDFIVFGTARSGTTAVAKYLSAAQEIFCGHEVFRLADDHAEIRAPQAFLTQADRLGGQAKKTHHEAAAEVAARQDKIRVYGNKLPVYFLRLQGVLDELRGVPAIWCVRNVRDTAASYKRRALMEKDQWPAGRRGLMACGDVMCAIRAVSALRDDNVLVLPHRALTTDQEATIGAAARFVAPGEDFHWDADALRTTDARRAMRAHVPYPEPDAAEREAITMLEEAGVDRLFDRDRPMWLRDIRSDLTALAARLPADPQGYIADLAAQGGEADVADYANRWTDMVGRTYRTAA